MAAGLISEDEFRYFTQHFLSLNAKNRDTWELRESIFDKTEVYLYKRVSVVDNKQTDQAYGSVSSTEDSMTHSQIVNDSDTITNVEEEDGGCLVSGADNSTLSASSGIHLMTSDTTASLVSLVYEYNIVYSRSYNVPVLYFNVYKADGSLLSLAEVWDRVPDVYRDRLEHDRWTFLSQQEHPILGRPYFHLHPCHTADLMEQVTSLSPPEKISNYIVAWLSAVGPVVGLELPLTFAQMTLDDPP
ncbi:ubiquitin-like-conjugating enzyme ATG10 [Ylistrum balloti]|uniref:ubiquitin-like-conjugating enzyme ATG10 n=1 Tax=Ylistrum balloti TaxID=509963 RepID=UPI002905ADBE|nr:ubiquitin-like-conjugating enzyme ATG10 [Ylistrum balloti]